MMKKILAAAAIAIVLFIGYVATRPSQVRVARSASVNAPAAVIYRQVADFHRWEAWSPWEKLDPAMKKTYSGPESGTGASYAWAGNSKVGEGKMAILDAEPGRRVEIRLEFIRPFASLSQTEFSFAPKGEATEVTWAMAGDSNFVAKVFGVFMNMDKAIGGDFERGLASLKAVSEAQKDAARPAAAR